MSEKSLRPVWLTFISLAISCAMFLVLHLLLMIPRLNPGMELQGNWTISEDGILRDIELPYGVNIREPRTVELTTTLPATEGESLVIYGLNATALTVRIDDIPVLRAGDHKNASANLWNTMFVIPLGDSKGDERVLKLRLSGHQTLHLVRIPTVEESTAANRRIALHRIFYHDLVLFFMGSSLMIGLVLIGFSVLRRPNSSEGLFLGLSMLLIAVYASDYTFRFSTGVFEVYNVLKRLVVASGYLGSFLFLAGLDHQANGRYRSSRWLALPNLACIMLILFAPSVGVMNQWLVGLNMVLLVNLILVIVIVIRKLRRSMLYVVASGLLILAIIQIILIMTLYRELPPVLQFIVVFTSILIGMQFLLDYREVYRDRDKLRREYDRDELTGAFNRRAIARLSPADYSTAVFLDLDKFKDFNDSYGHEQGDELLKSFVRIASDHLRRHDLVIRYGGDEFLILLEDAGTELTKMVIERIRQTFLSLTPESRVDISYGIDSIDKKGHLDIERLDRRMYAMKEEKRR